MSPQKVLPRRPSVSIVGLGNLGTALASTLASAGYAVDVLAVRGERKKPTHARALAARTGGRVVLLGKEPLETDIVWLTVPDDAIAAVASKIAGLQSWRNKMVFHSSGALTSEELAPLREKGARIASVHPLMTFVRGEAPEMAGVPFAIEGDVAAVRTARAVVEALGAEGFVIRSQNKALYHAFGSFASPLVIALMSSMETVAAAAGIREQDIKPLVVPLLWQTLRNYMKKDAASAFSGPLVRGDVTTIRKHLLALKRLPEARQVYIALCRASLKTLPVKNRKQIEAALREP